MDISSTDAILGLMVAVPVFAGLVWAWIKPVLILVAKGRTILGMTAVFLFPLSWLIAVVSRDYEAERRYQAEAMALLWQLVDPFGQGDPFLDMRSRIECE